MLPYVEQLLALLEAVLHLCRVELTFTHLVWLVSNDVELLQL